jgi:hypothetical protein
LRHIFLPTTNRGHFAISTSLDFRVQGDDHVDLALTVTQAHQLDQTLPVFGSMAGEYFSNFSCRG